MLCILYWGVARSLGSVVVNVCSRALFEAGDEIVDLTCESLEPVVVDLTHNDSVVVSLSLSARQHASEASARSGFALCGSSTVLSQHRCFRDVAGASLLVEGKPVCP